MKNSLGRVFLIFLTLLHVDIFASTYEWSSKANKATVYVNEAVHLTYTCKFSDKTELYAIDFNPAGDYEDYTIKLLKESEDIVDDKRVNSYEFVAFVKKAKEINFEFDTTMKKTTKESIQNTVMGRDNKEYEDFTLTSIKQKVIKVDVKPSPNNLVGEFSIEVKKDKQDIKAYEPYHIEIIIKGNGNFEAIKPIEFKIDGVKVFSGKVIENIELTKDGYSGTWSQKFAMVGEKEFTIPKQSIHYLNYKSKLEEVLKIDALKIEVTKGYEKAQLLDKEDKGFKFSYQYLYYLLTFMAGFLVSKIKFSREKEDKTKDVLFRDKIKNTKSLDELLMILVLKDSQKYKKIINEIESGELTSLQSAKKELL